MAGDYCCSNLFVYFFFKYLPYYLQDVLFSHHMIKVVVLTKKKKDRMLRAQSIYFFF